MPDHTDTVTKLDVAASPVVAEASRTISGRVLPWGEAGRTSQGSISFPRGSIRVPADITRVKLLAGHSPTGVPVGHATSWEAKDDGLYMTFQFGQTSEADTALMQAADHVIDAFSIEAYGIEKQGMTVTNSFLSAVALVPIPAYAGARVDAVHAAESDEYVTAEGDAAEGDAAPQNDRPDTDNMSTADTAEKEDDMTKNTLTPGTLPGDAEGGAPAEVHASFNDALDYFTAVANGDSTDGLIAELTDITDAGMVGRSAPQWLGELWSGVTYERRIVPLLTQAPLKSRKAIGYRWTKKPGVKEYAGNKAEIPSLPASIEPVERDAKRWAGGNDLDRAFWDFGETEFLNAYWRAMAESYAYETDQDAAKFLINEANDVADADHLIHAVARGALTIDKDLHSPATFALINPDDYESILALTNLDAPAYLDKVGPLADPARWVSSPFVPRGEVIVGAKAAVTHYELAGSPLRVEAEHLARGGRDAALFGYTALMVNKPEGLVSVKFGEKRETSEGTAS